MSNEILNEMDMLSETIELLKALKMIYEGQQELKRQIKYKGSIVEISFKLLKRG